MLTCRAPGLARVEDLSVFRVKEETRKELEYWHAAWMVEGKIARLLELIGRITVIREEMFSHKNLYCFPLLLSIGT